MILNLTQQIKTKFYLGQVALVPISYTFIFDKDYDETLFSQLLERIELAYSYLDPAYTGIVLEAQSNSLATGGTTIEYVSAIGATTREEKYGDTLVTQYSRLPYGQKYSNFVRQVQALALFLGIEL